MLSRRRRESLVLHGPIDGRRRRHLLEELAIAGNTEIQTNQRSRAEESREDLRDEHQSPPTPTSSDSRTKGCRSLFLLLLHLVDPSHGSLDERTERNLSISIVQERRLHDRTGRWESLRVECQGRQTSTALGRCQSLVSSSCITSIPTVISTKIWKRWKAPRRTSINSITFSWISPSTITTPSLLPSLVSFVRSSPVATSTPGRSVSLGRGKCSSDCFFAKVWNCSPAKVGLRPTALSRCYSRSSPHCAKRVPGSIWLLWTSRSRCTAPNKPSDTFPTSTRRAAGTQPRRPMAKRRREHTARHGKRSTIVYIESCSCPAEFPSLDGVWYCAVHVWSSFALSLSLYTYERTLLFLWSSVDFLLVWYSSSLQTSCDSTGHRTRRSCSIVSNVVHYLSHSFWYKPCSSPVTLTSSISMTILPTAPHSQRTPGSKEICLLIPLRVVLEPCYVAITKRCDTVHRRTILSLTNKWNHWMSLWSARSTHGRHWFNVLSFRRISVSERWWWWVSLNRL